MQNILTIKTKKILSIHNLKLYSLAHLLSSLLYVFFTLGSSQLFSFTDSFYSSFDVAMRRKTFLK